MTMFSGDDELGDYWVVYVRPDSHYGVPVEEGQRLYATIASMPPDGWVTFTTLSGAAITYRISAIEGVAETTAVQRDRGRAVGSAIRAEEKAAKPSGWSPDDDD